MDSYCDKCGDKMVKIQPNYKVFRVCPSCDGIPQRFEYGSVD